MVPGASGLELFKQENQLTAHTGTFYSETRKWGRFYFYKADFRFRDSVLGTQQAVVRGEGTLHHKVNATMLDRLYVSQTRQPSALRVCRATSL